MIMAARFTLIKLNIEAVLYKLASNEFLYEHLHVPKVVAAQVKTNILGCFVAGNNLELAGLVAKIIQEFVEFLTTETRKSFLRSIWECTTERKADCLCITESIPAAFPTKHISNIWYLEIP